MKKFIKDFCLVFFWIVFLISGWYLFILLVLEPAENNRVNENAKKQYVDTDLEYSFKKLAKINADIFGWITIPNTVINYPVVTTSANDEGYYLSHDFEKKPSAYGTIFVDVRSKVFESDCKNIVLHGHSMRNGSMFGGILKFTDENFCKNNKIIVFNTIKGNANWEVFSVFRVNTSPQKGMPFNYLVGEFTSNEKFIKFVEDVKSLSLFNLSVDVGGNDQILMLSTCSYEGDKSDDYRTVVAAKKI